MIELKIEMAGFFTVETWKVDSDGAEIEGTRHQPVPPFRNLITNGGLDRRGTNTDYLNYCQVGSGSTPPTNADNVLVARIASKENLQLGTLGIQPTPPYFCSETRIFQFSAGVAAGNISEIGIGWATSGSLFSRALVVDGTGSPTTITVLSDEILQVTYQLRYYPPLSDSTGTVLLNGVSYNWTARAGYVTNSNYWRASKLEVIDANIGGGSAFDGTIGASIVDGPSGSSNQPSSVSNQTYNQGSYTSVGTLTWSLGVGNFAGGIGALSVYHGGGCYQFGFTPKIPKNNTQTLALTFSHSWARKAL